ncbi:hypothetical protein ACMHYO_16345 [Allopusillimonas ginsengisoli]|uniref:hypothetical protein n=1 Tax=Allopusillimonas ginsengisoli TaxID=453575 RepID=UPI0039C17BC4
MKDLGFKEGLFAGALFAASSLVSFWLWVNWAKVEMLGAMTAFGTVGAVWFAIWQTLKLSNVKLSEERSRLSAVAITLDEALASLRWVIDHLRAVSDGTTALSEDEVKGFLYSANVVEAIPFHEHPYCKCYKDILPTVLKIKTAAHVTSSYLEGVRCAEALDQLEKHWELAFGGLTDALSKPSFQGVTRVVTAYLSPIRI